MATDVNATPRIPDFELIRRIGGGSYGDVWLGRSVTGVLRAVKIIERARFEDDRPFFRELEGITRFQQAVGDQPRQLALLHVGRDEAAGILYYVMELADDAATGTTIDPERYVPLTLKELRTRRQALPAADCLRIGAELATALEELHEAGLLHRDVKPSNVIFVNGRAKLADIGLIASTAYTVSSVGTPEYAPPEGTGSVRADLFSLGKILYELGTGLHPAEFPRLPADLPDRPDAGALVELNEVVLRACHVDPAQRYPDASALLADLRLLQAGRSVQELNRTRRQLRVLSWAGVVAGACALVAIGILGVKNYFAMRALAAQEATFRKAAEANERLARYTSDLHFAQLALGGGDLGAARTALRRQLPTAGASDLRGLEWYALWHQTEGDAVRTFGEVNSEPVTSVALAADGQSAVIIERATPNHAVMLDLKTGVRRPLAMDCYGLAAYDSTKSRLIVTRADLSVDVIDPKTRSRAPQNVRGIFLQSSMDGHRVLLARAERHSNRLFLWDVDTGKTVLEWKPAGESAAATFSHAAIDRDATLMAANRSWNDNSGRCEEVLLREVATGETTCLINDLNEITGLRFSSNGRWLAVSGKAEVRVVDVRRREVVGRVDVGGNSHALEFSPDSSILAIGGNDGLLTLWSVDDAAKTTTMSGHESAILAVRWLPDGNGLVTGGLDGTCRVWAPGRGQSRRVMSGLRAGELRSVVLSSGGDTVAATGQNRSVDVFDTALLRPRCSLADTQLPLAYIGEQDESLLTLSTTHELHSLRLAPCAKEPTGLKLPGDSTVVAHALSANRRYAVFGRASGELQVWDLPNHRDEGWREHLPAWIVAVAVSNDGNWVAAGDLTANLQLSNRGGAVWIPTNGAVVTSLVFSDDDKVLIAGTERGDIVVWDWRRRRQVAQVQAHSGAVRALVFTPDRTRLVSGGADGLIVVWRTETWRWLAAWTTDVPGPRAQHAIASLAIAGSGAWLAALTDAGELQRWDCRAEESSGR
ncbi:MAG TPA: serine/threonine-protein kinase [Opitutaceae bacterium]|nr:serine/threonine-protein kinase [Opitutaceae bacterium]